MKPLRATLLVAMLAGSPILAAPPTPLTIAPPPVTRLPAVLPVAMLVDAQSEQPSSLEQRVAELEKELKTSKQAAEKKRETDARKPSSRFTMQLQADSLHFDQDDANQATLGDIPDAAVFRRARVGWVGEYLLTEYRIEIDFALSGRPSFLDVWVGWNEVPLLGQVKVGHYFEPFCLDRYTPNRNMTFLERSLLDQAFAPARNLGIMASNYTEAQNATLAAGLFCTDSDNFGDEIGDVGGRSFTARGTWLPWYDEPSCGRYLLHLGAGYSFRGALEDAVQFRAQPEIRSNNTSPPTPFFVDTGSFAANSYQLYGLEAAVVRGPLSVQWEYVLTPVDRIGAEDVAFQASYLFASYFLTGEHRPYRRKQGVFDRVMPFEEFFLVRTRHGTCAGWGAWEVAARWSFVDLTDNGIQGGELNELTLGINWYMNAYTRITANYAHAFLDRAPAGPSNCDMWGLRAGFEF